MSELLSKRIFIFSSSPLTARPDASQRFHDAASKFYSTDSGISTVMSMDRKDI